MPSTAKAKIWSNPEKFKALTVEALANVGSLTVSVDHIHDSLHDLLPDRRGNGQPLRFRAGPVVARHLFGIFAKLRHDILSHPLNIMLTVQSFFANNHLTRLVNVIDGILPHVDPD